MMDDAPNVIEVQNLSKSFGSKTVVKALSMSVREGQIFGFLGPNGSGKTTTIRMICGLLTPDSGSGTCLGHDIFTDKEKIQRQVGYMTQKFSLYTDLTIRENLVFVARIYGVEHPGEAADRMLERLGLTGRRHQLAGKLSGGWKQRLALGACLLPSPKLLLLDEPTAGVDPKARRDFWDQIYDLSAEGITSLVSTHYMDEAERCHEIAYLAYGNLLARGTSQEVIDQAGLETWEVRGAGLDELSKRLREMPGVDMVAPFGTALHVSGTDHDALEETVSQLRDENDHDWKKSAPSLEDVFIHLMADSEDNYAP